MLLLQSTAMQQGIDSINQLLEGFMGINDTELGMHYSVIVNIISKLNLYSPWLKRLTAVM